MGKVLVIAEKPSVARDYASVLGCREKGEGCLIGDSYIVTWAVGHLVGLCEPEKYDAKYRSWRYEDLPILPEQMKHEVIRGASKQFQIVKKLMNSKEIERIICGTDSGREGELIFRYIYLMAGCKKPFDRLWISSMTKEAIEKGFASLRPGADYDTLYESARCRSEADWLVGMNGTRAYTVKYKALLSIGRVQTPTLAMIVNRQREIDAFVPSPYFELKGTFRKDLEEGAFFEALYVKSFEPLTTQLEDPSQAKALLSKLQGVKEGLVESVTDTEKKQLPPLLFDLTELQRSANRRYGYSAAKVLSIAQSLYEKHKLLTYPRTDSKYLPKDMIGRVYETLKALDIPELHEALAALPEKLPFSGRIINDAKITDHHALIPTPRRPELSKLSAEERNLYLMVASRLIEVFYPPYEYVSHSVVIRCGEDAFLARGRSIRQLGFMALHQNEKGSSGFGGEEDQATLPPLSEGEKLALSKIELLSKETKPPKPFTEATLLSAMEYAGKYIEEEEVREEMSQLSLGTPATRASIIERLIKVKYIQRRGKTLIPSEKGKALIAILPKELTSPETTGRWEKGLERIYEGTMEPERFMGSIRRYVAFIVNEAAQVKAVAIPQEERTYGKKASSGEVKKAPENLGKCPLCGGEVYENRKAFYCSNWKAKSCKLTLWKNALAKSGVAALEKESIKKLLLEGQLNIPGYVVTIGQDGLIKSKPI